jgi:hypothetical protein
MRRHQAFTLSAVPRVVKELAEKWTGVRDTRVGRHGRNTVPPLGSATAFYVGYAEDGGRRETLPRV